MFARFVLPSSAPLFTVAAFAVAASIYGTMAWRAARMRRPRADRLARLPFVSESPRDAHDTSSAPRP